MAKHQLFVGIDWATEEHVVCVLDADGNVVDERVVKHDGAALRRFVDWLLTLCERPDEIAVAIEVNRGAVVETLLERALQVYSINPKQLDRFRDRHTMAGAKDDRLDAYVLADSLRTDTKLYRRLDVDDPRVVLLREQVRVDHDLKTDVNRLTNQIREYLQRYFPQMLEVFAPDEPVFWSLFALAPTPQRAARLKEARVQKALLEHRIRRTTAAEVLAALQTTPLHVAAGVADANARSVGMAIERLRVAVRQRREVEKELSRILEELQQPDEPGESTDEKRRDHRDVAILLSFAGLGTKTVATMIAESQQALAGRDYRAIRALGGVAPVTKASGKRSRKKATVVMRRACSPLLRNAMYDWSFGAMQRDPASREYYSAQRARGNDHPQALRALADRNLRILMAMLRQGTVYDPTRAPKRKETACAA